MATRLVSRLTLIIRQMKRSESCATHSTRLWLLNPVRLIHSGGKTIPEEIALQMPEHVADDALSVREIEILRSGIC